MDKQMAMRSDNATAGKIAAIIPAFNEEERIGTVLEILRQVSVIDEITVVNDGSSDNTSRAARAYEVSVIDRPKNGGKGAAMQTGIEAVSDASIILFVDADLIGIKPEHIEDMIKPLMGDNDLMMTVGKFAGGRLTTDLAQAIVPSISGQRAIRKEFLKGLPDLSKTGFGVEIAITHHAKENNFKVEEVLLPYATQVMKEEKLGVVGGLRARMKMYSDIARQIIMRKLKISKS